MLEQINIVYGHCKDRSDEMLGSFIEMHKHSAHFRGHRPAYTGRKSTENKGFTKNIKMQQKKGHNNTSKTALGFN